MNDEWGTPLELFKTVNYHLYECVHDVCASDENHLGIPYWTKKDDALSKEWNFPEGTALWCNPPYSRGLINKFTDKIIEEVHKYNLIVVTLVRLDPSTTWFKKLYEYGNLWFLPKRLKFRGATSSYPFPCCIQIVTAGDSLFQPYYLRETYNNNE